MNKNLEPIHKMLVYYEKHDCKLSDVWNKLTKAYDEANNDIDKGMIKDIIDYFASEVSRISTISNFEQLFPAICSGDYFHDKLNDFKYDDRPKAKAYLKRNLPKEKSKAYNDWIVVENSDKHIYERDLKDCIEMTDEQIVAPLLGITKYQPKNIKKAIKKYQNHFKIDDSNFNLVEEISISDKLDNHQDRIGMMMGEEVIQRVDKYCLNQLKAKNFNHVLDPDDLTPSYLG